MTYLVQFDVPIFKKCYRPSHRQKGIVKSVIKNYTGSVGMSNMGQFRIVTFTITFEDGSFFIIDDYEPDYNGFAYDYDILIDKNVEFIMKTMDPDEGQLIAICNNELIFSFNFLTLIEDINMRASLGG
jgi:hypothetical protein